MTDENRTVVLLGNSNPQMQVDALHEDGRTVRVSVPARHLNQSETRVEMWDGFDDDEFVERTLSTDNDRILSMIANNLGPEHRKYAVGVHEVEQIVGVHHAGDKPDYVTSNDQAFADALAKHFSCPIGQPTLLLTTVGRDAIHAQHLGTSAQPASFNYMALTASSSTPLVGDTTLTAEINAGGGGLNRAQATYAHTGGTNTSTLTKTFTANGSDTLPVTVAQIGVFNASSSGTLGYHTALNATATLTISGDNVTVTETVTAG